MKNKMQAFNRLMIISMFMVLLVGCNQATTTQPVKSESESKVEVNKIFQAIKKPVDNNAGYKIELEYDNYKQEMYYDGYSNYVVKTKENNSDQEHEGYLIGTESYYCTNEKECTSTTKYDFKEVVVSMKDLLINNIEKQITNNEYEVTNSLDSYLVKLENNSIKYEINFKSDDNEIEYKLISNNDEFNFIGKFEIENVDKIAIPND